MRKTITSILLMAAMSLMAQEQPAQAPQWSSYCDSAQVNLELPSHYCACREGSEDFHFPLDMELTDTVWYTATVSELRMGMSAYWFADCSVTLEVFAFCTSKLPTISVTVGANQMRDVDAAYINKKLDEMGETARLLSETLVPHIRAYPNNGGSGRVYCYPFDQGPESTCEDPLPLRSGMTYVCDKPYNTYRMEWKQIPSSGNAFIHWKQKNNLPGEIWLTLDSCTGEEVGRVVLTDSLHVYIPDSAMLVNARKANRELWLHVQHNDGTTGRVFWYNRPKYAEALEPFTQNNCSGKKVTLNLRTYETDTAFTDLLWVAKDTLTTMDVNLTFTQPEIEYDTLRLTQTQLNIGYRYTSGDVFHEYGDHDIYVKKANTCTRHIIVTVLEPEKEQPVSPCGDVLLLQSGMTNICDEPYNRYRMEWTELPSSGNAFIHWKQEKNLPGEIWLTLDSCTGEEVGRAVLTDSLHVYLPDSAMLVNASKDKRELWLHVQHADELTGCVFWYNDPTYAEALEPVTQSICSGKNMTLNLRTYETDTAFTDLLWVAKDTLTTMDVALTFTQPELELDTIKLKQEDLNAGYLYTTGDVFHEFGDYEIYVENVNTCTRHIIVTVLEDKEEPPVDPHEALDEAYTTPVKITKSLRNGQLIIHKNGRKYNVFGQSMK